MKVVLNIALKELKKLKKQSFQKNHKYFLRFFFFKGMIGIWLCIYETAANMYFIKIKGLTCLAYSRRTTSVRKKRWMNTSSSQLTLSETRVSGD